MLNCKSFYFNSANHVFLDQIKIALSILKINKTDVLTYLKLHKNLLTLL